MLDELLEDIQLAIEELQMQTALLEVIELLLVNRQAASICDQTTARYIHAILVQALAVGECASDMVKLYPDRLAE